MTGPVGPVPMVAGPAATPIGPIDHLLGETFRLGAQRAGHLLPYIVLFVLSLGLVGAVAGFYGLRDTVITVDEEAATVDIDYGGSAAALAVYLALFPASMVGGVVAKAATARQTWAAQAGSPETWAASLQGVARRWRPVLLGALGRTGLYWVLGTAFLVGSALVPPLILLLPVVLATYVFIWLRLAFVSQAAVLGPDGSGPFATSFRVSGRSSGRLLGRLIVLALAAASLFLVISLIGSMVSAIAGVDAGDEIDPGGMVYDLDAYLGPNVAVFALGAVFAALGLGAFYAFTAVGTTLLYRNLDGPVDAGLLEAVAPAPVDGVADAVEGPVPPDPGP